MTLFGGAFVAFPELGLDLDVLRSRGGSAAFASTSSRVFAFLTSTRGPSSTQVLPRNGTTGREAA